jgi:hypothetical protein|tara:strand:+ start:223 stop:372 length:150 start_codon:yes stop_codon:yes gene_type:complete
MKIVTIGLRTFETPLIKTLKEGNEVDIYKKRKILRSLSTNESVNNYFFI